MSTRFLKSLFVFVATLSLIPTATAMPIPISSPTAIALVVYLSVVPVSFILLFIVKYCYVKNRKADAASGHALSSGFSPQPRTRYHLGHRIVESDCTITRTAFLVGLLGSPDWEIKVKESEHSTVEDTNSQFSYVAFLHSELNPMGYISPGSFLSDIARAPSSPVGTTNSACSVCWGEPLSLRVYGFLPPPILCLPQTNLSFTLWTPPPPPLKVLSGISYWTLRS